VQQEAQVVRQDSVQLATLRATDDLVLVVREIHGHNSGVKLSLMGESPLATCKIHFLNLAVSTSYEKHVAVHAAADQAVACQWHGRSVELLRDAKQANLASCSAREEHISVDQGEVVGTNQSSVRQLNRGRR